MKYKPLSICVIILTFNEEKHLSHLLNSIKALEAKVFILDSGSTDNTELIAKKYGAEFIYHQWVNNHAIQFNWGLENLPIKTGWVLKMDADEYLLPELISEIKEKLPNLENDITGVMLKRRVYFMNRWIKYGGYYPTFLLRLWRYGAGKFEERWMDEHVKLENGSTITFENDFVDDNLNNLTWWTNKHNDYATREAIDLLNNKQNFSSIDAIDAKLTSSQDKRKRWLKEKIYSRSPLFIRPFFYFIYRYIFKLGFLDGIPGLVWHFLQGFWYRFLVDAKIYDIKRRAKKENCPISDIIEKHYGIKLKS